MYNFPLCIINWYGSFLLNRSFRVKIQNKFSGVPQGSNSAGPLFNVYINDLPNVISHAKILLFADDAKIFLKIGSINDCYKLQYDISNLNQWCLRNKVILNAAKCETISFYKKTKNFDFSYDINDIIINRKEIVKDLGILYDEKLNFNSHLLYVINKSNKMIAFIKRNTLLFRNSIAIKNLYISLVRSNIMYGSLIWRPNNKKDIEQIEKIQHKILRYMAFKDKLQFNKFCHDYSNLMLKYELPSILSLFKANEAIFLYKIMSGSINCVSLNNLLPRNNNRISMRKSLYFYPNLPLIKLYERDPIYRLCVIGNNLLIKKPFLSSFDFDLSKVIVLIKMIFYNYSNSDIV